MKYTFYTDLSIEECKEKLNKYLRNPYHANGEVVGKGESNNFWAVKVCTYNGILINRAFYGYFEEAEEGTLIKDEWRYIPFMRCLITLF